MIAVRDVTTVQVGDPVTLVLHDTRILAKFQGSTPWDVITSWGGFEARTPYDSSLSWVEDSHGEVIRRIMPDPVLEGSPPELE